MIRERWELEKARQAAIAAGTEAKTGPELKKERMEQIRQKLKGNPAKVVSTADFDLWQTGGGKNLVR